MSSTRILASYLSKLKYEDLPPSVVEKGKLTILDAVGNMIGGYPLRLSRTFLDLAKDLGGGREEATLIGDGTKVSVPLAAFGNGALSTMLDYDDIFSNESGRSSAWMGVLAVPAALAAGESRGISGKELICSAVAGYECAARIVQSMDKTAEQAERVSGSTVSVFSAAGAAGRALGLGEDQFLSALGMAGIYTPVHAAHKYMRDEGLTPSRDIKQGWSWMCMTGAFAAVSARKGLKMLQENNILDGDRGLWRMLGMDIFKEEELTAGLGQTYHILRFRTKINPGLATNHKAIVGVTGLVKDHSIDVGDIERIEVFTSRAEGLALDDQDPDGLVGMQFSIPYQVSAALLAGDPGPNWYSEKTAKSAGITSMTKRVSVTSDEECEQVFRDSHVQITKVNVLTRAGHRYSRRVDRLEYARTVDEVRDKFITTTSQVIDRARTDEIASTIENLEAVGNISHLIDLLHIPSNG